MTESEFLNSSEYQEINKKGPIPPKNVIENYIKDDTQSKKGERSLKYSEYADIDLDDIQFNNKDQKNELA